MPTVNGSCGSIKEEAINRLLMLGERSLYYALQQYLAYYHAERNHQGLGNQLIAPEPTGSRQGSTVMRRERLGGLLSYYHREAP
jgi:hypothetical protein